MISKTDDQKPVQTASPRQWIGLVVFYLLIPLILLVCGGDFSWWQAWVYSLLFVTAGIGERLALPPFLEPKRAQIEAGLKPILMPLADKAA